MAHLSKLRVQMAVSDSESNKQFELSNVLKSVSVDWSLYDQPGKMTFEYVEDTKTVFFEGSNVTFTVNGILFFDGYVFTRTRTEKFACTCTCYDRLRYLQNKDTQVFENQSVTEIFTILCQEQELPFKVVDSGDWKTAPASYDNESLYVMIKKAMDEEMIATNTFLTVRDYQGTLQLINIANLTTNCFIGDGSLLTGYSFESSIDSNTYNYIKLTKEDSEKGVRNAYITKDSTNIYKWGRLQYYEKQDKDANDAQIKEKADRLLKLYNRRTKTLSVTCLGDVSVREGCGVGIAVKSLENEEIAYMQYAFVSKATHTFSKESHTMQLELKIV